MEDMFFRVFERVIHGIVCLMLLGSIAWWTIDLQKKAAESKSHGLISLVRVNQAFFGRGGYRNH